MRISFIFLCSIFLISCSQRIYTIKNDYRENIVVGDVVLTPSQCVEFFDFPFIGDFPIKLRYKDRQLISDKAYPPAHYMISEQGEILKQSKACRIETVRAKEPPVNFETTPVVSPEDEASVETSSGGSPPPNSPDEEQ